MKIANEVSKNNRTSYSLFKKKILSTATTPDPILVNRK